MWKYIKEQSKPVVLYGTGDCAEKILNKCGEEGIKVSGIFASDDFVRDREFCGYKVLSYSQAKEQFGDMLVLLAFGSHLPEVIENIKRINSEQEMLAPDFPIAGDVLFTREYLKQHIVSMNLGLLRTRLADEQSRRVLDDIVAYKLNGKLEFLFDSETPDDKNWELLQLDKNESFLDLGAYTGDTAAQFIQAVGGSYNNIYAFEPEERNFRKLSEFAQGKENFNCYKLAAWDKKETLQFEKGKGRGGQTGAEKTYPVEADAPDAVLAGKPISFIKFDVEGAELQAIEGCKNIIKEQTPKMLIAAYHRTGDIVDIEKKIRLINDNYDIYLRKSPCLPCWEVNYYFVPKK